MIREATRRDVPAMIRMARSFHDASPMATLPFCDRAAAAATMGAVDDQNTLALILDLDGPVGALVAHLAVYPLGNTITAKEAVFWIEPAARGRWAMKMIRAYEAWATERGAEVIGMSCFGDGAERLFKRAGFRPAEINTIKGI